MFSRSTRSSYTMKISLLKFLFFEIEDQFGPYLYWFSFCDMYLAILPSLDFFQSLELIQQHPAILYELFLWAFENLYIVPSQIWAGWFQGPGTQPGCKNPSPWTVIFCLPILHVSRNKGWNQVSPAVTAFTETAKACSFIICNFIFYFSF